MLEHKDTILIEQVLINTTSNSAIPTGAAYDEGRNELSIAEALIDYHSAFIGKWNIGGLGTEGYQPANQGFEPLAWFDAGGSVYSNWKEGWDNKVKNRYPKMPQEFSEMGNSGQETNELYLTDDLAAQALNFIDKKSQN